MTEQVILVDETDRVVGCMEKVQAHERGGALHRAFSIFIFDDAGQLLLQRRNERKYHFGGLWSNACCGHPRPGEETLAAAGRRLGEELAIDVRLYPLFTFVYRATDAVSGLAENELDHVFGGLHRGPCGPDPEEIDATCWMTPESLLTELGETPGVFTPWFGKVAERAIMAWNDVIFPEKS